MSTILIAGGTGLIGKRLSAMLAQQGHTVYHLSRSASPDATYKTYQWNPTKKEIDKAALSSADYVINLAGAGIADKRWTDKRKKIIINSRVNGNELLAETLPQFPNIKAYVSASAIGYYGDRGTTVLSEKDTPGKEGFLSESVVAWEKSIGLVAATGIRTVVVRIGIVLSTEGGALEKLLLPFKAWLGVYFGDGQQVYSWIHQDDLVRIFIQAIKEEKMSGVYNGVAPNPVSNKVFTKITADVLGKSALIVPSPAFAMRLAMGEMADVVLTGSNVSSKKIEATGFEFKFPTLDVALKELL